MGLHSFISGIIFLLVTASASSQNIVQLSCKLEIEKRFSEGGAPRRYFNDSIVRVLHEPSKQVIKVEGPNFGIHLDTSLQFDETVSQRFSDEQWEMTWSSKDENGKIQINRVTGNLYATSFFQDSSGWMKSVVSGPCRKIDPTKHMF